MEIHPPERPLHSGRDILLQLVIVTIGILLALSLDSLVEWRHNLALVREAREKLAQEIRDNKRSVDSALKRVPELIEGHRQALQYIHERLAHKKPTIHAIRMSYSSVLLSDSSWRTAEATGVLGHMRYADVQKFTDVYTLQAEAMRLQQRTLDVVIAEAQRVEFERPDELTDDDLAGWKQQVLATLSCFRAEENIGQALSDAYQVALETEGLAAVRPQPREKPPHPPA
jgi:hypothetical protein